MPNAAKEGPEVQCGSGLVQKLLQAAGGRRGTGAAVFGHYGRPRKCNKALISGCTRGTGPEEVSRSDCCTVGAVELQLARGTAARAQGACGQGPASPVCLSPRLDAPINTNLAVPSLHV